MMNKEDQTTDETHVIQPRNLDHKKNWWAKAMARHQKWINEGGFHQLKNAILPQVQKSLTLPSVKTVDAKQSLEKQNDGAIRNTASTSTLK